MEQLRVRQTRGGAALQVLKGLRLWTGEELKKEFISSTRSVSFRRLFPPPLPPSPPANWRRPNEG